MFFDNVNLDSVFDDYVRRMQESGNLEKKASYAVPRSLIDGSKYDEISVEADLRKIAAAGGSEKLYGLFSDDLPREAHPEGSPEMVKAPDNLGVVEDLEDKHKAMLEVAQSKVKLAHKILNLSAELDKDGFIALAKNLDMVVRELLKRD